MKKLLKIGKLALGSFILTLSITKLANAQGVSVAPTKGIVSTSIAIIGAGYHGNTTVWIEFGLLQHKLRTVVLLRMFGP
jgi:hypothetical protein